MVAVAQAETRMRLVNAEANHRTERRIFGRRPLQARAEAWRLDNTLPARRAPKLALEVRDISLNGMSALSEQPVAKGERVSVYFPPGQGLGPWDAYGRVVRCEGSALGYRVAVEFDPRPAA